MKDCSLWLGGSRVNPWRNCAGSSSIRGAIMVPINCIVCGSDLRLHFGLGKSSTEQKIVIHWPSGQVEMLSDLPANRYYVVREGSGVDQSKTHGVGSVRINTPGTTAK
jgi:hypothetical protein